jgi:hypothetical protein
MVSFTKTAKTFGENGSVSRTEARVLQDLASKGQLDAAGQAQLKALLEGARFENADTAALQNVLGRCRARRLARQRGHARSLQPVPGLRNDGVSVEDHHREPAASARDRPDRLRAGGGQDQRHAEGRW